MKKALGLFLVIGLAVSLTLVGCGTQKAESSQAAIAESKTMQTTQEKVNYLVSQAQAFYSSKDFQQAVDIAQYVLSYLDKDSAAAKSILEKAKADLSEQLSQKAEEIKGANVSKIPNLDYIYIKDIIKKIGGKIE